MIILHVRALFKDIRTTIDIITDTAVLRVIVLSVLKFEDSQERMTIPYAFLVILLNVAIVSSGEDELSTTSISCYGESAVSLES